jgi:hypothetical protein
MLDHRASHVCVLCLNISLLTLHPVTPHTPRETGCVFTRTCGLARASNRVLPRHLTRLCVCVVYVRMSQFPVAAGNDPAPNSAKSSLLPRVCGLASPVALARNGHQDSEQKGSDSRRSPSRVRAPLHSMSQVSCSVSSTYAKSREVVLRASASLSPSLPPLLWEPRCGKYHHATPTGCAKRGPRHRKRAAGK